MDSKIRLFTALAVPEDFRAAMAKLPRKGLDAQWAHPEDLHITIRFLGDVVEHRLPEIKETLGRIRRAPFHVDVRGLGLFDNKSQAILHATIESTRKLTALCADITDALVPLGFDFGTRPFIPHITLARLNGRGGLPAYIGRHGGNVRGHWEATGFALMRSAAPDGAGRHYNVAEHYPLKS